MIAVARTFAALKWRLVVNGARHTKMQGVALIGATLAVLAALGVGLGAAVNGHGTDPVAVRTAAIGTYSVLFAIWVFGPLLVGVDETVDPNRLALVPLTRRELRIGLAVAAVIGIGPLAAAIVMLGLVVGFVRADASALLVGAAAVVGFAMACSASRAVATMLARAQRSRRGRDVSVVLAGLVGAGLWSTTQLIGRVDHDAATRVLNGLRWTPPGCVGQAFVDAAAGRAGAAAAGLVLAIGCTAVFAWLWSAGVAALSVDPGVSSASRDAGAAARRRTWGRSEMSAAAYKESRYLVRAPARRTALLVATTMGTVIVVINALGRSTPPPGAVLFAPGAALFTLSMVNNQLGYDSSSLWLEVAAGGPRRAHLVGRSIGWLPALVVPCVPAALVLAWRSGGWAYVPLAIVLAVAVAGVPLGVGACCSVYAPFRVPDTGSPFANRNANTGQGCVVGLVAMIATFCDALLLVPAVIAVAVLHDRGPVAAACSVALAALWAWGCWWLAMGVATRHVAGREPELLTALAPRR